MKIWLIKMLYRSLSPYEQWKCHKYLQHPLINEIMTDQAGRMDKNWLRSVSYKETQTAKIFDFPGVSDLLRLKNFRHPWMGWLYCHIWLPLTAKRTQKPDTTHPGGD